MGALAVEGAREGACTVLVLRGELAMSGVDELTAPALAALSDRTVEELVLDLAAITFVDSTGLGALVSLHSTACDVGSRLVLRNPTPRLAELIRIIAMDDVFVTDPPIATGRHRA